MKETPPSQNEKEGQTEPPATPSAAQASNNYLNSVNASQATSGSVVGLSIVPVKVKVKGSSKKVLTYAFLDSDSNTSFCTEDLRKLGAKGKKTSLSLTTMQTSNQSIECSLVNLEISYLSKKSLIELPMVYSTPSLPVSSDTVATQEDVNRW